MGRYLDMAKALKGHSIPGLWYEINELNEITPPGETWGAAAASARVVLLHCPPGVPEAWVQGVADLLAMARPASCPAERWQTLREDAYHFLQDHAARAHELGWSAFDLFGVHRERPWVRFDCIGLVPLLNGARVTALSDIEAAIEKPSGARLTFRRRADVPNEACLIWDIGRKRTCLTVVRQQH